MTKDIRQIRVDGKVAYVPLTRGYEAVIEADDIPIVAGRNWFAQIARKPDGSVRTVYAVANFRRSDGTRSLLRLHRLINSTPCGLETDHIDGDGLNNRRANLRNVTTAENVRNARIRLNNSSGFKGVYWDNRASKWCGQIVSNGVKVCLGYYETAVDAHAAYCEASARLHGEFGRTS
jgi:hypothetical protein